MLASNSRHRLSSIPSWRHSQVVAAKQDDLAVHEQERVLVRLERISRLFDDVFRVPGTSIRLGWDALLGLIPLVGDGTTTIISMYYLWEARRLGARKRVLARMLWNVGVDFCVGTIPLLGDLVDVAWRANRKNMRVLIKELQDLGKLPEDTTDHRLARLIARHGKNRRAKPVAPRFAARPWPFTMP